MDKHARTKEYISQKAPNSPDSKDLDREPGHADTICYCPEFEMACPARAGPKLRYVRKLAVLHLTVVTLTGFGSKKYYARSKRNSF